QSVTSETFDQETCDEETVLINFVTGFYFSLRGSASLIWRLLKTPITLDELLAAVVDDPSAAHDVVQAMIDRLIAENCVQGVQVGESEISRSHEPIYKAYTPPIVEAFHDLKELAWRAVQRGRVRRNTR